MPSVLKWIVPLALCALSSAALADPWKDESGNHRHGKRGEYKEEYWDGQCKVKRKVKKNGEFKEERKCKPQKRHVRQDYHYRQPVVDERVYYVPQPVHAQPGIEVDVRIRP